jgi:hypothetical protein
LKKFVVPPELKLGICPKEVYFTFSYCVYFKKLCYLCRRIVNHKINSPVQSKFYRQIKI